MSRPPDQPLDALGLAATGSVVERDFRIAEFARLADCLARPEGSAKVQVAFRQIEGVATGTLQLRATALLICQRCLGPVNRVMESESQLAFVDQDDAAVPEDCEAIVGDPRRLDLAALVEDELLLSLPLIARHAPPETCAMPADAGKLVSQDGQAPDELRRPFAGLKDLLKT